MGLWLDCEVEEGLTVMTRACSDNFAVRLTCQVRQWLHCSSRISTNGHERHRGHATLQSNQVVWELKFEFSQVNI